MTTPPKTPTRKPSKERRAALRVALYEQVAKGEIGLVDAVKALRKITGRTQTEYAHLVGVSPRILMQLERSVGNPTIKTLARILAPFDLEVGVRRRPRD